MIYPIEYRKIPTQYAFLVEKTAKGYEVKIRATQELKDKCFKTEKEAREFISVAEII